MKCACKSYSQHIKEHLPYNIRVFGIWFLVKTHIQVYYWWRPRRYVRKFFNKFKKKKSYPEYCYTGTNGIPVTITSPSNYYI